MTKARSNQSGMSIVEVLTAVTVISIMSLSVAYFSNTKAQSNQNESLDAFNCQVQVNSVLSSFRGEGQSTWMLYYYPHLAYNHPETGLPTGNAEDDYAVEVADVWKDKAPEFMPESFNKAGKKLILVDQTVAGKPLTVNMAPIQRSAVFLLEELYNKNPKFCTDSDGSTTPELTKLADGYSYMAKRPSDEDSARSIADTSYDQLSETAFKIIPYNLADGKLLTSCPTNIGAVPMGVNAKKTSFRVDGAANDLIQPRSTNNLNIGYQLDIITTVTSKKTGKAVGRCAGSQRFEYQRDTILPSRPVMHAVISNTTIKYFEQVGGSNTNRPDAGQPADALAVHTSRNRYEVAFRFEVLKRGNLMLCRDRSQVPQQHPLAVANGSQCMGASPADRATNPGPGPQRFSGPNSNAPAMKNPYTSGGLRAMPGIDGAWKPCDQVTLCGVKPTESRIVAKDSAKPLDTLTGVRDAMALDTDKDGQIDQLTFINQYLNLRPECVGNIEMAITDSAGNLEIAGSTINASELLNLEKNPKEAKLGDTKLQTLSKSEKAGIDHADQLTEVARPMCGNWCAASRTAMDVYFPGLADATGAGGYWQQGACCVTIPAGQAYGDENLYRDKNMLATIQAYNLAYACQPGYQGSMGFTLGSPPPDPGGNFVYAVSTDSYAASGNAFPQPTLSDLDETRYVSPYVQSGSRPPSDVLLTIINAGAPPLASNPELPPK